MRYRAPQDPLGPGAARGRIVTPVTDRSKFQWSPFVVIDDDHCSYWREDTDTCGTDFQDLLRIPQSTIVVGNSAFWADSTRELRNADNCFDYLIGRGAKTTYMFGPDPDDDLESTVLNFEIEWCLSWGLSPKRLRAAGRLKTHKGYPWHTILDPVNFFGHTHISALNDSDDLYRWATEYREWCRKRNVKMASSKGGAAAKVLRTVVDAPQVKVPIGTNNTLRPYLCSSHIRTYTAPREVVERAMEFDQKGAYHECARTMALPDRNEFVVKGDFHSRDTVWFEPGDTEFEYLLHREHGLLLVTVEQYSENQYRTKYPLSPYMPWTGDPIALFTNEIVLARRMGLVITGIIAAWTSAVRGKDLARHAVIAQKELKETTDPFTLQWLKPLNLAVYGMTASVPHAVRSRTLDGDRKDGPFFECKTNHVAWLGMLQAEVRKRSVMLAADLSAEGARVVSVYADAVYAEPYNLELDHIIPRYFTTTEHHNLKVRKNMLASDETLKAPGLAKTDPNRATRAREFLDAA